MLKLEAVCDTDTRSGKALRAILVKRALMEVVVTRGLEASRLLSNAKYQLSLKRLAGDRSRLLARESNALLASCLQSLEMRLAQLKESLERLDELDLVLSLKSEELDEVAVLLEESRDRLKKLGLTVSAWKQQLKGASQP